MPVIVVEDAITRCYPPLVGWGETIVDTEQEFSSLSSEGEENNDDNDKENDEITGIRYKRNVKTKKNTRARLTKRKV
jgi:hypothetical protein